MAMLNWNDYRNQILARVGEIGKLSPDTVKGYATDAEMSSAIGTAPIRFWWLAVAVAASSFQPRRHVRYLCANRVNLEGQQVGFSV